MKIKLVFDDGTETEISEQGLKELMKVLKVLNDENNKEKTTIPYVIPWYPTEYPYGTWIGPDGTSHYEIHTQECWEVT